MSIPQSEAANLDRPDVLELIWKGLQQFLFALAANDFRVPITISLKDADGDLVRDFVVTGRLKILPDARTAGADRAYVLPLNAKAVDVNGRTAVLKLDGALVEKVKFLN